MGAVDYIQYFEKLYDLDTREWGMRFIYSYLEGLSQQYMLISMLLNDKETTWHYQNQKYDIMKKDPVWKEFHQISGRLLAVLKERQLAIAKEIKDFLADDFWEIITNGYEIFNAKINLISGCKFYKFIII